VRLLIAGAVTSSGVLPAVGSFFGWPGFKLSGDGTMRQILGYSRRVLMDVLPHGRHIDEL
jgi:hypothetical protein